LLHGRIGASVLKVWQKLRSHLRELERKNNRIEDLRNRINEISKLSEHDIPLSFLTNFLSPAHMWLVDQLMIKWQYLPLLHPHHVNSEKVRVHSGL